VSSVSIRDTVEANRGLVLTAMIFAVAMTFIDQTIVSIAAPKIQTELGLSDTGIQWAINSYLLTLAAFFAFGGKLADTIGHRPMVIIGVATFAAASGMCGLTPKGAAAEAWLVTFRAVQGLGGALMYPAALAIVVDHYPLRERGKALALFFGIAGGLTAVGPAVGGYLTEWTWRAIFWINIPVAIIALVLIAKANPKSVRRPVRLDYRGLVLITGGVALSVFGFQQSAQWGWTNPLTGLAIAVGAVMVGTFLHVERRTASPLIDVRFFSNHTFLLDNVILLVSMMVFIPIFFFASEYAQVALGESASKASLALLYFFAGFVVAAQIGGRMLDRRGAKRPVVIGCALACVALALWADRVTTLTIGPQVWCIVLAGAGMGFMLGPANTDALNQATSETYGEATGITQTGRNYGASLGLAVLGTVLATVFRNHLTASLIGQGMPPVRAHHVASSAANLSGGSAGGMLPLVVRMSFATATQTVLYTMAGIMGLAFLVALLGLRRGVSGAPAEVRQPTVAVEREA
jgi:EmrB/QacA subfamily drug resistance transporter